MGTSEEAMQGPTVLVVLGATGDLMTKKIVPALFSLHEKKGLPPQFELMGVSRREWTDDDFRQHVRTSLGVKAPDASQKSVDSFLKLATYHKVTFESPEDYVALLGKLEKMDAERGARANRLFYLSVPPQFYEVIFENVRKAHLADVLDPEAGWTRIIVEKPFGRDLTSAKALDARLGKLFKEEQIYRIDHYLAKETFQNILAFRFMNSLFEEEWGNDFIEKIHIREFENVGAEDRGAFYENVGALRDVGQNHLLQMLALVTMDRPRNLSADAVRASRAAILATLEPPLSAREMKERTFRAQYDGYRTIKGVAPKSGVETYFRVRAYLAHPRWRGVPIIMEAGKRLARPNEDEVTEIEVVLKHPQPCLCPFGSSGVAHQTNRIIFRQDPKESITIHFWAKKPGFPSFAKAMKGRPMELEERTFEFEMRQSARKSQYTEEYEKLLLDCIAGDQTLFVASPEIAAMWRFVDPIERAWQKNLVPLRTYVPDSAAISAEAAVSDRIDIASRYGSPYRLAMSIRKEVGIVGLGKMGAGLARQLHDKGWRVVAYNRNLEKVAEIEKDGIEGARTLDALVENLRNRNLETSKPRNPAVIWLMVTAGKPVDDFLFGKNGLASKLKRGDIVIDGGNSFFEDAVRRSKLLAKKGIKLLDAGVSGGPSGARDGACVMVGGDVQTFTTLEPLFSDISVPNGYAHVGPSGSGHFVKMVHNGIEYGMMQSIAEGFALMRKSPFRLDLKKVARLYNNGSVIESRLVGWLESGFGTFGQDLKNVSSTVAYTGEGEWTVTTGKKWKIKLPAIEDSFKFRVRSKKSPSPSGSAQAYMGKILSALRNQFGGHDAGK